MPSWARGKSADTTAKLHSGRPAVQVPTKPDQRRMLLCRLNFKIGAAAGKRIA
jgi:hypothetical protein